MKEVEDEVVVALVCDPEVAGAGGVVRAEFPAARAARCTLEAAPDRANPRAGRPVRHRHVHDQTVRVGHFVAEAGTVQEARIRLLPPSRTACRGSGCPGRRRKVGAGGADRSGR